MPKSILSGSLSGSLAGSFLLAACTSTPSAPPPSSGAPTIPDAQYVVRIEDPTTNSVEVELTLTGLNPAADTVVLALPRRFAFVELPEPLLEGEPEVRGEGGEPLAVERLDPFAWSVETTGAERLHARVTIPLRHRELPAVLDRDAYEFPYLAGDHGMLVAGTMFLSPRVPRVTGRVRFELPDGWGVHAPWPRLADGSYEPPERDCLHADLIAIGAWEARAIDAGGCLIDVVVAPGQPGLLDAVGPLIERIVRAEIELFGRQPFEKYLFLFGRPDPPLSPTERGLSLGGSPKSGSMTLMLRGPLQGAAQGPHLGHLIAHEFHHTWVHPGLQTPDELRFVNEGFTEYYAWVVLAREGLLDARGLAGAVEEKLRSYYANAVREELSLLDAGGPRFFEERGAYSLVYDGGFLFAALLDRMIRNSNEEASLDELMRAFRNDVRFLDGATPPRPEDFFRLFEDYLPAEDAPRLRELAERRGEIDFIAELRATDAPIDAERGPARLDLRANLDGTRIRNLDPSGIAHRIGLRSGDRFLEVNGVPCKQSGQIHSAWQTPREGRIRVVYTRNGEEHVLDEAVPEALVIEVEPEPWRDHRATVSDRLPIPAP